MIYYLLTVATRICVVEDEKEFVWNQNYEGSSCKGDDVMYESTVMQGVSVWTMIQASSIQ